MSSGRPILAALRGLPGIGKSALAQALGRELGWPVLDKDDCKDVLYGRAEAADELAYDLLFRLARRQLQLGLSVVCDSRCCSRACTPWLAARPRRRGRSWPCSTAAWPTTPSTGAASRHAGTPADQGPGAWRTGLACSPTRRGSPGAPATSWRRPATLSTWASPWR